MTIADEVEAGLKPKKCGRCGADYTLFLRQTQEACRFDDFCQPCAMRSCLNCLICLARADWKDAIRALQDALNDINLEE